MKKMNGFYYSDKNEEFYVFSEAGKAYRMESLKQVEDYTAFCNRYKLHSENSLSDWGNKNGFSFFYLHSEEKLAEVRKALKKAGLQVAQETKEAFYFHSPEAAKDAFGLVRWVVVASVKPCFKPTAKVLW